MPEARRAYLQQSMLISLRKRLWFLFPSGPLVSLVLDLLGVPLLTAALLGGLTWVVLVAGSAYRSYQRHRDDLPSQSKRQF